MKNEKWKTKNEKRKKNETKRREARNSNPRRGRIVCDCGCDDHLEENKATSSGSNFDGYDELD